MTDSDQDEDEFSELVQPRAKAVGSSKAGKSRKGRKKKSSGLPTTWILGGAALLAVAAGTALLWAFLQSRGGAFVALPAADSNASAKQLPAVARLDYSKEVRPFFEKYCYSCHGPDFQEGGVEFHTYPDAASVAADRKLWTKAFDLVKVGAMPPSSSDQPTEAERKQIVSWLDHTLFYVDCDVQSDPGRVTIRRLNRNEYNNTVRDLLGVDFQPAESFPSDDVGYGFDNIGDVLSVPPLLIEKYLDAAEQVAARAIITRDPHYFDRHIDGSQLKTEGAAKPEASGLAIISRGSGSTEITFQSSGTYRLKLRGSGTQGGDEFPKLEFKLDNTALATFEFPGHREQKTHEYEFQVKSGKHRLTFSFINDFYDPDNPDPRRRDRNAYLHWIEVAGPIGEPDELPESHRLLTAVKPGEGRSVRDAAHANLKAFLPRAFRRPVTDAEISQFTRFAEMAVEQGDSFAAGMQVALQAVLVSPSFLFRIEDRTPQPGQVSVPVDQYGMASRLSYFIWSSMPDDELLRLAAENRLQDEAVLIQQTKRMLADPKADALIANFPGQWLGLRKLETNEVTPDPEVFPEFNDMIRYDFWKETELFFGMIVRENRSIYDMLDARYTYVNERLAKFYGIPDVKGSEFRKVVLSDGHRAGLLTQGSILTLTSFPTRTSPVKRGQWVLENLLGTPPPAAPPVVPALEETQKAHPGLSFREQLILHRADPGCASCHKLMDDIGFGLQNFDAVGRWREMDGEFPVDARGVLPTGEEFNGPMELIQILRKRKDQFSRCLTEKLLTYATGRGVEYYDKCSVDEVLERLQKDDRFENLVIGVVLSTPFRARRGQLMD